MGRRLQRRLPARMNICLSPSLRLQRPKFVGYILNAFLRNLPKFKADNKGDIGSTTLAVALYRASLIPDAIIRAVTVWEMTILNPSFYPQQPKALVCNHGCHAPLSIHYARSSFSCTHTSAGAPFTWRYRLYPIWLRW